MTMNDHVTISIHIPTNLTNDEIVKAFAAFGDNLMVKIERFEVEESEVEEADPIMLFEAQAYLESKLEDGYVLADGVTFEDAAINVAGQLLADMDAYVDHIADKAAERAVENWDIAEANQDVDYSSLLVEVSE